MQLAARWRMRLARIRKVAEASELCLPMTGVFIRFSQVDDSTLITHAAPGERVSSAREPDHFKPGERVMFLDFVAFAPVVTKRTPEAMAREAEYHQRYRQLAAEAERKQLEIENMLRARSQELLAANAQLNELEKELAKLRRGEVT